jgi:glutathione peroxidase
VTTAFDFDATSLTGQAAPLSAHAGKVLLVVNTASRCGFTPQYAGLEEMFKDLAPRGFAVLGFPCNQFGAQEPGADGEIASFCELSYGVTFPMHAKIDVNGPEAHPLWKWMKGEAKGLLGSEAIKWNFTKFLIDRSGAVVKRYGPNETPASIRADVERLLGPVPAA